MPITADEIEEKLRGSFPDGRFQLQDLTGGGDHWALVVVSSAFANRMPIDRHRMVYDALGASMQADIHALALTTRTPAEAERDHPNLSPRTLA